MKRLKQQYKNIKMVSAFTLAEVLITLGIIGVVAAMVIPTLINNTQKQEYLTAFKKAYTTLNQAIISIANDAGCTGNLACTGLFSTASGNSAFGNALADKLKVMKNCGSGSGCWAKYYQNIDGSGNLIDLNSNNTTYKFMTQDGMSISVQSIGNDCKSDYSTGAIGFMKEVCATITVDINGFKKPNRDGRDVFEIWVTNGKGASLYPRCGKDDNNYGTGSCWWYSNNECSNTNPSGPYCAGKIIEQGWQMNY